MDTTLVFGDRYRLALKCLELREGGANITDKEMVELVARATGQPPKAVTTANRWRKGAVPDLTTISGIARVCEVDPGWLAFGEASGAPGPDAAASLSAATVARPDHDRRPA